MHLEHVLTKLYTALSVYMEQKSFKLLKVSNNQTVLSHHYTCTVVIHVRTYLVLVDSNDVGKEREELDLHGHKIDVELLVEAGGLAGDRRGLQHDGLHCEGNEVSYGGVHRALVELGRERGGGRKGGEGLLKWPRTCLSRFPLMKRLGNKSMIENGLTLVHVVFYIIVCMCTLVIHQGLEVNFLHQMLQSDI